MTPRRYPAEQDLDVSQTEFVGQSHRISERLKNMKIDFNMQVETTA